MKMVYSRITYVRSTPLSHDTDFERQELLHFALLQYALEMLLHFASVLHFAAIHITFCVSITFYYIYSEILYHKRWQ